MKVDPVVSNSDQMFMANMTQINKIKFLESEKSKNEAYIKDLQYNLSLNKQSFSNLASNKKQQSLNKLNQQNVFLLSKLQTYYDDLMNVNALLLIQQQLRIEQKKFYSERILDFQTNMIQLRKYLQDKQQSFASVVSRLKKYQDLNEITLQTKLHKISNDLHETYIEDLFKKLTEQRDKYKNAWEKINITIEQMSFLKNCLQNKKSYQAMQNSYIKLKQQLKKQDKEKAVSFYEKTKNSSPNISANLSTTLQKSNSQQGNMKNPNKQLIKLLKKQKLNNQILQQALNEAIQKNQELILQNSNLVQANSQLKFKVQKLESKGYLLEQQLSRYDKSLAWNQQWKSRCDIDRQKRINEFEKKGNQQEICLIAMEEDMQKLSSFILTCVPKGNLVKSSSNPNFARPNQNPVGQQDDDIQIQQI